MRFSALAIAVVLSASCLVAALSPAQWRSQSIYQIVTDRFARTDGSTTSSCNTGAQVYCGGTWRGIINKLDYIQGMGFTAIWISPIVKNLEGNSGDGSAYHGYWAQNIYQVNPNFGTEADLVALSAALHSRGMYLMVDIVTNHMGYLGCGNCVDYGVFTPFNSKSYYHDFCLINYNDQNSIKNCWMGSNIVSLPDLRTEDANVRTIWNNWITDLVSKYSIDGLRIDSAQQVDNGFFPPFQSAAGVYIVGEVYNGNPTYVCPYQNHMSGVMNFPAYFWIRQAFETTTGSISNLVNGINTMKSTCGDTTLLGSFMENHDVSRFASKTSDLSLAKNAIAFTMLMDGIPIIYYGQEQRYAGGEVPYDREALWLSGYSTSSVLYTFISSLNKLRSRVVTQDASYLTYKAYPSYSDSSTIVMRKGSANAQVISVFSNSGASGSSYALTLTSAQTGFTANQALIEVLGCTAATTDANGGLAVAMSGGVPRVYYPRARLTGSGICGSLTGSSSQTATPTSQPSQTSLTTSRPLTTASCIPSPTIAVTFSIRVTTSVGQTIKILGNTASLGNWAPASAIALSASQYTSNNPVWVGTVNLPAGTAIQYKFIRVESSGSVTWEGGSNRAYTVPTGCTGTASVSGTWQ